MGSRLELQGLLERVLGSKSAYFQPPENVKMTYPAIVYSLYDIWHYHADNLPYISKNAYGIILIDRNPESEFVSKISSLPLCSFDRFYVSDNLNHWVFTMYY